MVKFQRKHFATFYDVVGVDDSLSFTVFIKRFSKLSEAAKYCEDNEWKIEKQLSVRKELLTLKIFNVVDEVKDEEDL